MRGLLILTLSSAAVSLQAATDPFPSEIVPPRVDGARVRRVVFILADDHRFDAMSFLGHPLARIPRMDSMAENGVHLKSAFVTTSSALRAVRPC